MQTAASSVANSPTPHDHESPRFPLPQCPLLFTRIPHRYPIQARSIKINPLDTLLYLCLCESRYQGVYPQHNLNLFHAIRLDPCSECKHYKPLQAHSAFFGMRASANLAIDSCSSACISLSTPTGGWQMGVNSSSITP